VAKKSDRVRLDLNSPKFLAKLFKLSKDEKHALLNALERISQMTWHQVYRDRGLKWEAIRGKRVASGDRLYTFRCTRSSRAVAKREGSFLVLLSIHTDHDSAYA